MSSVAPHTSWTTSDRRAVVLLSGGLDSLTTLAIARAEGHTCYTLAVHYGQRHRAELVAARQFSAQYGAAEHREIDVSSIGSFGGSALTDSKMAVPDHGSTADGAIPSTYVPARNTLFLSIALGWAEVLAARAIYIGVNAVDYSGYPDCRPDYIAAFSRMASLATRGGVSGQAVEIRAPLQHDSKARIIQRGLALGIDYSLSVSCYQADDDGRACGRCDACALRRAGFGDAGVADPTRYQTTSPTR